MVGLSGLEPPASPLSGVRSNQLSYRPPTGHLLLPSLPLLKSFSSKGSAIIPLIYTLSTPFAKYFKYFFEILEKQLY